MKMGRAVKINITLPEEELKEVDAFVQRQGDTRSGVVQQALRSFMEQKEKDEEAKRIRAEMLKAISGIRQLRQRSGEWDGVAEIRKWRESK